MNKSKILTLLKNSSDFISGQQLCEKLGVSRTAVWKYIKQLKEDGYEIESISNKGYRLLSIPDILSKDEIMEGLSTNSLGKEMHIYDKIDSTNKHAKRLALEGANHGMLVIAEQQTQGKGRMGRKWISKDKSGIWMTLILRPKNHPNQASMLTLLAGLAVVKTINQLTDIKAWIKWPNDIIINQKKVAGILTEMSSEIDYINYVIVGIGINVNTEEFDLEIKDIATSIFIENKKEYNRSHIIKRILELFEEYYEKFLANGSLKPFIQEYMELCITMNKEVKVIKGQDTFIGYAQRINEYGEIIIIDKNERIHKINSGEVSVRGMYGYA